MKRKVLMGLLLGAMALGLAACGQTGNSNGAANGTNGATSNGTTATQPAAPANGSMNGGNGGSVNGGSMNNDGAAGQQNNQ